MQIKFDNVSYKYNSKDNYALKDINLDLAKNEIIFILGHTGSGKSTLLQHLNGLLFPKEGKVEIEVNDNKYLVNEKEKNIKNLRRDVGLVFQFPENQLFENSVLKDVMFGPMNFGYTEKEAKELAIKSLNLLGIDETYYERSPFDLSGGEKRKVAIAGVLASKPKILVLDEPTSSLDNKSTREFFDLLNKLKQEGTTIIVVSHDVNLCYEYADKVIIMSKGMIKKIDNVENAFLDEEILKQASIELPFLLKVKKRLNLTPTFRNMKDLTSYLREVKIHE